MSLFCDSRVPAGITIWHRPQGVFVAQGQDFKQDELLFGARLLDVTPTILHFFGLPRGEDMEGRVLEEAFATPRPVATIPSWEQPDDGGTLRADLGEEGNRALLEQFVALGYIDEIPQDNTAAIEETTRNRKRGIAKESQKGDILLCSRPALENRRVRGFSNFRKVFACMIFRRVERSMCDWRLWRTSGWIDSGVSGCGLHQGNARRRVTRVIP
jgi:hypothetical protein